MIGTVKVIRTRFFEEDVWEGDYPRDDFREEHFEVDDLDEAVRVFEREGLTFSATGNDWAANPDGTQIVDYATAEREEVTAHLVGFSDADTDAVIERVG